MVDQHTRLHTWPFLSIFVEIFPRRRWIRRSGERNHRRIICFHSRPFQKFFELKISRGGSSIEGRKRRGRTLLFIVDILRNKKRKRRKKQDFPMETNVCSIRDWKKRESRDLFSSRWFRKKFTRTRPWTALQGEKKRFHPFFSFFSFFCNLLLLSSSSSSFSERCPDCVRLRSSNERVQTKLLFR